MRLNLSLKSCGALLCATNLLGAPAFAQDSAAPAAEVPASPSADAPLTEGAAPRPLWEVGLAGGVGTFADYPASDRYSTRALPLPYFIYRGGVFRSDASGPRLHAASGNVEFEFSGGGALSTSSGGARNGMPKLDDLLEAGPNAKITLDRPTSSSRLLVDLPVRVAISTNFSSHLDWRGVVFAPDIAFEDESLFGSRWGGRVGVGVEFTTARLQQYYYQVEPRYIIPGERPAYDAHGGYLGSRLTFSAYRPLTRNFNVYFAGEFDLYSGAENNDSPLFRSNTGFGGIVGFAWSVWQSKERAANAY
jgi:outer membrane protein